MTKLVVVAAFLAATVVAWWLAPLLGVAMTVALVAAVGILAVPEVFQTWVRGPGYQYREPPRDQRDR